MSILINSCNYTTNDKLLKQKLENQTLPVPFLILMMSNKKLTNTGKLVYSLMRYRRQLSMEHPYKYFDQEGRFYFVYFQLAELEYITGTGKKAIRHGIAQLDSLGLIVKHKPKYFKRSPRFELPKVPKGTHESAKTNRVKRSNTRTKRTSKSVNTKTVKNERKFIPVSAIELWKNSAQKMGLTVDVINRIAEFSSTYGQNAYKITGFIKEARDITANRFHIDKKTRRFEINQNIIDHLGKKLRDLLSDVVSKSFKKAKLSNYAGFLINSLKRFFKWTFGKGKDETVKPKTDNRHSNHYRKRKPIKEGIPQWMKDQQAGKTPKTKKTGKLLTNLIQARNAYDTVAMQADDPMKPNPDHDKMVLLKKRLDHCQKLYDTKRKATKPTPKPKQYKQSKGLHKTSRALCDQIQARLRRLGEN